MEWPTQFSTAVTRKRGALLRSLLHIGSAEFRKWLESNSKEHVLLTVGQLQPDIWRPTAKAYAEAMIAFHIESDVETVFTRYMQVLVEMTKRASHESCWILPALTTVSVGLVELSTLRAIDPRDNLSATARTVNGVLRVCLTDKNEDLADSRRRGTYTFAAILLRVYFQLRAFSLARGVVKVITDVSDGLPALEESRLEDQVSYRYYHGVLEFFDQHLWAADKLLTRALELTPNTAHSTQRRILTYLLPVRLKIAGTHPRKEVWTSFSDLAVVYQDLFTACKHGNYRKFQELLTRHRSLFVRRNLYLTLQALSADCLLRLVIMTWKIRAKTPRLSISDLAVAFETAGYFEDTPETVNRYDAVELLIANHIVEGHIKGYISHSMRTLVLSKQNPFPGLVRTINTA